MKGIIIEYFEEKGFGNIIDENQEKRFFHISSIKEKSIFLSNIRKYLYTDWVERKCYVVSFIPSANEIGLKAIEINLTNQIFNDKSIRCEFEGKVTSLKYDVITFTKIVQGIKKNSPIPIGATLGDNGTYTLGYPEVIKKVNICFQKTDNIGWGVIEVRELVLAINHRNKITNKLIKTLEDRLVGNTITIHQDNNWTLKDHSILKV